MPERWQDELKKLRREEMPGGVRERAEAGPRRELPNDGRQRLVAGVVAFAVFIAAGTFAWRAFGGTSTTGAEPTPSPSAAPIALDLESNGGNPAATLSSGDASQEGTRGGYSWCGSDGECVSGHVDFATYPPVSEYLPVPAGAAVEVTGDGRLTGVQTVLPNGDRAPADVRSSMDPLVSPSVPDRYVWILDAKWENGAANYYVGIEVAPPPDQVPDVLHLTCTPDSATLDSSRVRPRSDGFHVVVDASDEVVGGAVVNDPSMPFGGLGGPLQDDGEKVLLVEPGTWHIGCYARGGGVEVGPAAARFEVVDPAGVYTPVALVCDEPTTRLFPVNGTPSSGADGRYEPTAQTVDESVAAVPGILATDVVREAGYADGPGFKGGPLYTVLRNGQAVARLHIPVEVSGSWSVSVDACPGTGIGPDAPPGAAGPTPDTVVVRCIGARAEVSTPIVNAQADGLHLEVENAGGTRAVTVASGWDRQRTLTVAVGDQGLTSSVVVPARPGYVRISCRTNDGSDPGDDPFLDRRSDGLQLQDPAGYFLPYAPTCDSSEEVPIATAGAGVLPSSDTVIRARVAGILGDDVVERAGYLEGRGDEGLWRVVRDGEVVAQIFYPAETGIACRGSGIAGA
ncbi:MAG: hypothetical protein H0W82_09400 [Actinobacteria bacterium]|nr:hypothetical protein [Actinomycetota bacterium]